MAVTWQELQNSLIADAKKRQDMISASFELTARCNLKCKMCYISYSANEESVLDQELTTEQWLDIAEQARDSGLLYLTLTGGEILLRPDFRYLYEKFIGMGFLIQIFTNGTLITKETVEWLSKIPPLRVSITLYGLSSEIYERITGNAHAYQRAVQAVDMLLAAGIRTEIKTTVVKGNEHDFNNLAKFARDRGLGFGIVNYVSPRREGFNSDPVGQRLSPSELIRYEEGVSLHNLQLLEEKGSQIEIFSDTFDNDPKEIEVNQHQTPNAFDCNAGTCAAWITWDGRLIPCGIMNKPATFPIKTGFRNAWDKLKVECSNIPVCDQCRVCEYRAYCNSCPGRRITESGYADRPTDYLCETAKLRAELSKVLDDRSDKGYEELR